MTKYLLIIQKKEENKNFAVELADYEEKNRKNRYMGIHDSAMPTPEITSDALIAELTPEQFNKIKLEAIKAFE